MIHVVFYNASNSQVYPAQWLENIYGNLVANKEQFQEIKEEITYRSSCGIEVRFWLVGRQYCTTKIPTA